jgi:hypothetical protein
VSNKYSIQRDVFRRAIFSGWDGKEPSALASRHSDKSFYEALEYLLNDLQKVGMLDYKPAVPAERQETP